MEQMLLKMARQLDALDEASLMGLWEKYMQIVSRFEPSQRWQEAVLVLSLIQAKHWKNQLSNGPNDSGTPVQIYQQVETKSSPSLPTPCHFLWKRRQNPAAITKKEQKY